MSSSGTSGAVAERLLKLAIALALLIILVGPILAVSLHVAGPRLTDYVSRTVLGTIYKSGDSDGITAGPEFYALENLEDKLTGLSAYRGEAKGAAKTLQILLIRHDRPVPAAPRPPAFTPLKLDLSAAGEAATLIIGDRPLLLAFGGGAPPRRAMLAVEGVAPFDLENAPQGLLAGFRIAAFGANRVARPEQLVEAKDAAVFCAAVKAWRTFYGLPQDAVRVAVATNATAIVVTDQAVSDNGDAPVDVPALATFCKRY